MAMPALPSRDNTSVVTLDYHSMNVAPKELNPSYAPIPYTRFDVVDSLLSSGDIDARWKHDRNQICMNENTSMLPVDSACMSKSGINPYSTRQRCVGCTVMSRLTGEPIISGSPILVKAGTLKGERFISQSCDTGGQYSVGYIPTRTPNRIGKEIYEKLDQMESCQPGIGSRISLLEFMSTSSPPENYAMISSIVEKIVSKFNTTPLFQWSYVCQSTTHVIDRIPDRGIGSFTNLLTQIGAGNTSDLRSGIVGNSDLRSGIVGNSDSIPNGITPNGICIEPNIMMGLVSQLAITLKELSKTDFVHGSPSLIYLGWDAKQNTLTVSGLTREHTATYPVTLHLNMSASSSITAENKRYFLSSDTGTPSSAIPAESMEIWMVAPSSLGKRCVNAGSLNSPGPSPGSLNSPGPATGSLNSPGPAPGSLNSLPCVPELASSMVQGYRIGNRLNAYMSAIRSGLPLFTSFDLYIFLFSMMVEPAFYNTALANSHFMSIWKSLFKPNEYTHIMSTIESHVNSGSGHMSFEELASAFTIYTFRCDAVDALYYSLFD